MGTEGTYFNIIKAICDKPMVTILLNCEKLKTFPLRPGTGQECPLLPLLFNIGSDVVSRALGKEEKIAVIQIGKAELKLLLCSDDMLKYLENP